jgi:uncharacterized beta-barrel protein YwiB (DUF1934 family)
LIRCKRKVRINADRNIDLKYMILYFERLSIGLSSARLDKFGGNMRKEILIKIKGIQLGMEEEFLTVSAPGIYHNTNGKHYIQYEEKPEPGIVIKNILKISPTGIMLTRKRDLGTRHSQMFFERNETTRTDYPTPYGSLPLEIKTKSIKLVEAVDTIEVILEYSLYSNDSWLSDNVLSINVESAKC